MSLELRVILLGNKEVETKDHWPLEFQLAEKWNEAAVAFEISLSETADCQICPKLYECKFEKKSNDKIGCLQMMQMRKNMTKLDEIQEVK